MSDEEPRKTFKGAGTIKPAVFEIKASSSLGWRKDEWKQGHSQETTLTVQASDDNILNLRVPVRMEYPFPTGTEEGSLNHSSPHA